MYHTDNQSIKDKSQSVFYGIYAFIVPVDCKIEEKPICVLWNIGLYSPCTL